MVRPSIQDHGPRYQFVSITISYNNSLYNSHQGLLATTFTSKVSQTSCTTCFMNGCHARFPNWTLKVKMSNVHPMRHIEIAHLLQVYFPYIPHRSIHYHSFAFAKHNMFSMQFDSFCITHAERKTNNTKAFQVQNRVEGFWVSAGNRKCAIRGEVPEYNIVKVALVLSTEFDSKLKHN